MPTALTIGRIAKLAEVNIETVRYYERRGLLPAPPRTDAGYRLYDEQSVARLRFIKQAQALGFTLEEIGELLALRVDTETSCDEVRQRAERKTADVAEKIRSLQAIQGALAELVATCALGGGPEGECPFLASLERQSEVEETE